MCPLIIFEDPSKEKSTLFTPNYLNLSLIIPILGVSILDYFQVTISSLFHFLTFSWFTSGFCFPSVFSIHLSFLPALLFFMKLFHCVFLVGYYIPVLNIPLQKLTGFLEALWHCLLILPKQPWGRNIC